MCPFSVAMQVPSTASQIRRVLSPDPETIRAPSGENAQHLTQSVCPFSVLVQAPVAMLQILRVLSSDPETRLAPSGENAQHLTFFEGKWMEGDFGLVDGL